MPEHDKLRARMQELADFFGFKFLCFKKYSGFLSRPEGGTGSTLLVAEWREAKPIVDALNKTTPQRDVRMCVVVRSAKMLWRACTWAKEQRNSDIMVVLELCIWDVECLVANYLQMLGLSKVCFSR